MKNCNSTAVGTCWFWKKGWPPYVSRGKRTVVPRVFSYLMEAKLWKGGQGTNADERQLPARWGSAVAAGAAAAGKSPLLLTGAAARCCALQGGWGSALQEPVGSAAARRRWGPRPPELWIQPRAHVHGGLWVGHHGSLQGKGGQRASCGRELLPGQTKPGSRACSLFHLQQRPVAPSPADCLLKHDGAPR